MPDEDKAGRIDQVAADMASKRAARYASMFWAVLEREKASFGVVFSIAFLLLKHCRISASANEAMREKWNGMVGRLGRELLIEPPKGPRTEEHKE